jgi:hypothetical protein
MNTNDSAIMSVLNARRSRRSVLKKFGLGVGAGMLGASGLGLLTQKAQAADGPGQDAEVLNFALNLEYLEAQFYCYATTGKGIDSQGVALTGSGTQGTVVIKSTSPMVPFTSGGPIQQYANEIAADEINHVKYLRAALMAAGVQPVAMPQIDLLNSFNTAAQAAGVVPSGGTFDPFSSETYFLVGAYIFEDVGVTAYHGGAPLITNRDYVSAAAGIMGTEAYHAGVVRTLLYQMGTATQTITAQISALRATLDGTGTGAGSDDQGVFVNNTANLVPTDANSLVFSRTTQQVLNIVYGSASGTPGLFYPNGMNGAIH